MARRTKFNSELAERIRDNLFTEEEKALLTYQVGSVHIDIKDQLLTHYGCQYIAASHKKGYKENDLFIDFAVMKKERGDFILEKLRVAEDRIKYLMMPANFYKTVNKSYSRDQTNTGENESSSEQNFKTDNYGYTSQQSLSENRAGSIGKNLAASNSEVTTGLEAELYKALKLNTFNKRLQHKKISLTTDNKQRLSKIQLADGDKVENSPVEAFEATNQPPKLYAQQAISVAHQNNEFYGESNSEAVNLNTSGGDTSNRSTFHNQGNIRGQISAKDYVSSEADLKVLKMEIPALRRKFWMVFWPLFTSVAII